MSDTPASSDWVPALISAVGQIDIRTVLTALAVLISLSTFYVNYRWQVKGRDRVELREHFDADVRAITLGNLERLRELHRKTLSLLNDASKHEKWASEIDRLRDGEFGPLMFEVGQTLLSAHDDYGALLPSISVEATGERMPLSTYFLDHHEDAYDELMEQLSDLISEARAQGAPVQTAEFSDSVFQYDRAARGYLNEIRTRIVTGKARPRMIQKLTHQV